MHGICLLRTTNADHFQYENEDTVGRRVTCFDADLHGSPFTGYVILCGGYTLSGIRVLAFKAFTYIIGVHIVVGYGEPMTHIMTMRSFKILSNPMQLINNQIFHVY